mmetsp:Transcript_140544/g.365686  ORF Transcript_140544/g.365686 Transcript_140544/m.365686 type:complete len:221 (+) Transcript_140544:677-1339(+)
MASALPAPGMLALLALLVLPQERLCLGVLIVSGDFGGGPPLPVLRRWIRPRHQQPMNSFEAAQGSGLVKGRVAQRILTVRIGRGIEEYPHDRRVPVAARPMQRCGACAVRQLQACTPLQEVEDSLYGATSAIVMQSCSALGVYRIEEPPNFGVELQEEQITIQRSLEEVCCPPWVLPRRHAQEVVPPIATLGLLALFHSLPLTEYGHQLSWHLPLRGARD